MIKLLGANWQTTLTGVGTALFAALTWISAVSYDTSPLSLVIPPTYKPWVQYIAGIATVILWIWNGIVQKSRNVTGGTVQQTADGSVASSSSQLKSSSVIETHQSISKP